jgi:hypothetical protein
MTTIYIVTDGDYSDYHICGVYSTKKLAKKAQELHMASSIEEYEIDAMEDCPAGMLPWSVRMGADGRTHWEGKTGVERERITYFKTQNEWAPYGDGQAVCFRMFAKDETHAIKIANERRAQLIASGEWTTNWEEWQKRIKASPVAAK